MFTCEDCYAVCEGKEKHPYAQACDEYDGQEEEVAQDVYGDEVYVLHDAERDVRMLFGICALLRERVDEMERKFDTIIAAIVKAAGPEEER